MVCMKPFQLFLKQFMWSVQLRACVYVPDVLDQWFSTGEEFFPLEEFHEFREGISILWLSYEDFFKLTLAFSISYITLYL